MYNYRDVLQIVNRTIRTKELDSRKRRRVKNKERITIHVVDVKRPSSSDTGVRSRKP